MEISAEYTGDDHAARDTDVYAHAKYRWTLRVFAKQRIPRDRRVVNIGCGAGTFSRILVESGYMVHAVEPDPAAFEIAKLTSGPRCLVENKGVFDLDPEQSYPAAVMHDVLEHIEHDRDAMARLARIVQPGGLLIISVPALQWLFGKHDEQLGHFRRYTKKTMEAVIPAEFEVLDFKYFGLISIPIVWIFSKKLRRSYPAPTSGRISPAMKIYGFVCSAETRLPEPLGTSLLVALRRK